MLRQRLVLAAVAAFFVCAPAEAARHHRPHAHHHAQRHHAPAPTDIFHRTWHWLMSIRDDIAAYARQHGLDPAYALAVAERESSFNPNAHASKTIHGLYQMSGAERQRLGIPLTTDVGTQTEGFARYTQGLHDDMASRLGREPTPSEMYLGHYWGPGRAAGVISGHYAGLTARDVFTPRELAENPNLKPDKPVGEIAANIQADMGRRYAKFGGQGGPSVASVADPSIYLTPQGDGGEKATRSDDLQANYERNRAFTKQGVTAENDFTTKLSPDEEQQFRGWVDKNKVPFDPSADGAQDYDMRGFWKGLQNGDPNAKNAVDPNDGKMHYPDFWKTPYHETFSNESQWANPDTAPKWNEKDQLVEPSTGKVLFDDRARPQPAPPLGNDNIALNSTPARSTPSAPAATPSSPSDDSAMTTAAMNDTGGGDKDSLGDDLSDLAKGIGSAMSKQGSAPSASPQNSNMELLQQLALAQQAQTPVDGLPSLPGQKQQGSSSLPTGSQSAPSYLDPRMFGIQPQQG